MTCRTETRGSTRTSAATTAATASLVQVIIPKSYNTEENPPKLKLVYDETVSDKGEEGTIYGQKDDGTIFIVAECDVDGVAEPSPCHGPAHTKNNGDVRYFVYLLSGDPIFGKHR